jgi:hypothetical protein
MMIEFLPSHFSDLRRAAYELHTVEELKAFILHIADEIELSYRGRNCAWCHRLISGRLPASPCVIGVE